MELSNLAERRSVQWKGLQEVDIVGEVGGAVEAEGLEDHINDNVLLRALVVQLYSIMID